MRNRNKKATGGGWESRKNRRSQPRGRDRSSRSISCIIPDTGTAFLSVMLFAAILYASDIVTLSNNLHLAEVFLPEKLDVKTA